jgi:hypothetical protein
LHACNPHNHSNLTRPFLPSQGHRIVDLWEHRDELLRRGCAGHLPGAQPDAAAPR